MKNVSDTSCRENQNTHFMFNKIFFFFENHAVYEKMWKNIVEPGRPHMKVWRMRMVGWIQTHTQNMQYLLLSHCNSGCTNTSPCYVILTFLVLLQLCSKQETTWRLCCKWGNGTTMSLARYGETQ